MKIRGWLLLFIVAIFLFLIDQNARNSGCDWLIQLSDIGRPITSKYQVRCHRSLFHSDSSLLRFL